MQIPGVFIYIEETRKFKEGMVFFEGKEYGQSGLTINLV